jgi:hypothetical protein
MSTRKASRTGSNAIKYKLASAGHSVIPDLPEKVTIGTATGGSGEATVTFTPSLTGGVATSFTATATPGGATKTGTSSPLIVQSLVGGTAYTFTVTANNASGTSPVSDPSNQVTPTELVLFQLTSSGSWTAPSSGTYEIHCVGGGGGGGGYYGSGGAGGFYSTANLSLVGGTAYTVTVGGFGARADSGTAGSGGPTSFVGPSTVTANGGGGGSSRNFGTSGVGGNGGSGGAPAANAGNGWGGGGGGYDGSNSSWSTNPSNGGQNPGLGQLNVTIGTGTNTKIPGGGASGFFQQQYGGVRVGLGGPYQGIYGFGIGSGGNFGGLNAEGQNGSMATGRGCGGGGANWYANGSGNGTPGMIVIKKIS